VGGRGREIGRRGFRERECECERCREKEREGDGQGVFEQQDVGVRVVGPLIRGMFIVHLGIKCGGG
jgi:hypothetical protein